MVGFWVQRIGTMVKSPETQMLQPMHSRMSSMRPSSIFFGRKGSAIEGRAAPMKSSMPRLICETMVSGEVKRPTPTTGLRRQLLDEGDEGLLVALLGEARGHEIVAPVADVDVPEVGQLGQHLDDRREPSPSQVMPSAPDQLVDREAHGDGAGVADRLLGVLDQLAQQAHAVLQAAAVFVGALVAAARRKCDGERAVVAGIDIDDVEAGAPARAAPRRDASGDRSRMSALSMARACTG